MIVFPDKIMDVFLGDIIDTFRASKDISAQRMASKNKVFEIIVYGFFRLIKVRRNFIQYHTFFFLHFILRKGGVKDDIME
ncbi:hypothetical protein D3C85_1117380 [compost metagenome]